MKAKKVYIEARCNDGTTRNLSYPEWALYTGKGESSIRKHQSDKQNGRRDITNRQVVGLDKVPDMPMGKKPKKIILQVEALRNSVLYRRLA